MLGRSVTSRRRAPPIQVRLDSITVEEFGVATSGGVWVAAGVYECYGSINPQLAERTGFSNEDAEVIKAILPKLFENDASSARPDGSMEVLKVIWWKHNSRAGQYSSAKVHRSLTVNSDGTINLNNLDRLAPEEIDGF